jgi:hypothetical protein
LNTARTDSRRLVQPATEAWMRGPIRRSTETVFLTDRPIANLNTIF